MPPSQSLSRKACQGGGASALVAAETSACSFARVHSAAASTGSSSGKTPPASAGGSAARSLSTKSPHSTAMSGGCASGTTWHTSSAAATCFFEASRSLSPKAACCRRARSESPRGAKKRRSRSRSRTCSTSVLRASRALPTGCAASPSLNISPSPSGLKAACSCSRRCSRFPQALSSSLDATRYLFVSLPSRGSSSHTRAQKKAESRPGAARTCRREELAAVVEDLEVIGEASAVPGPSSRPSAQPSTSSSSTFGNLSFPAMQKAARPTMSHMPSGSWIRCQGSVSLCTATLAASLSRPSSSDSDSTRPSSSQSWSTPGGAWSVSPAWPQTSSVPSAGPASSAFAVTSCARSPRISSAMRLRSQEAPGVLAEEATARCGPCSGSWPPAPPAKSSADQAAQ
mmetsp:Transcript_4712/g.14030  ORF Transcript_4712/g.14030 Transcript_4712/m.14030 type:complete len:400 (+) Transcript_4712:919-2118(+)